MRRWARRLALGLALVVAIISAPIVWIESACTAPRAAGAGVPAPLVSDPGYVRRESDSYLSFPEWHIVYAYEDLAAVLRRGDEGDFAYTAQVAGFWRSLCELHRVVTARGAVGRDTKVMLYTIGWSFTAELGIKGAYETTLGRAFAWLRGPRKTAEDQFAAGDMQVYAEFLHQTPWYQYPFAKQLGEFWRRTPVTGPDLARKLERRAVVTLEYGTKAIYGALIGYASATALGAADLEIQSVIVGLEPGDAAREPQIKVVRELGGGRTLVRTPRYQAYTDLLVRLARRGRDVAEIAGNRRILATVLALPGPLPALAGTTELFTVPIQSRPDRRRVGLDIAVERLGATIRALEKGGATIEHVYDVSSDQLPRAGSAFRAIRAIDYTVIFARDMAAMRRFYEDILGFPLLRELSPGWIEYRVGDNTLALARPSRTAADAPTPSGSASLQLAFKVSAPDVDRCAGELVRQGITLLSPPTDQVFGHRTVFFRDPDGNLLEVFAEI